MKKITLFLFFLFFFMFLSCNNEEELIETNTSSIENKDAMLQELAEFTQYSINGALIFYDKSNDFIDLEKLDQYISKFNFSNRVESRSEPKYYNTINYENSLKEILSTEAYNLLLSYLSSPGQINKESLEKLKNDFSHFTNDDKVFFDLMYSATNVIYSEIISFNEANTRAVRNSLACNIATGLAGSAAGWIWGAAFGGPVGVAISIAWEVAATVAAYHTC